MTKGHWASILVALGSIGSLLSGSDNTHLIGGIAAILVSVTTALFSPSIADVNDKSVSRKP